MGEETPSEKDVSEESPKGFSKSKERKAYSMDGVAGISGFGGHGGIAFWRGLSTNSYLGGILLSGKGDITAKSDTALLLEYMSASYLEFDAGLRHFFSKTFYAQSVLAYANYSGKYGIKGNEAKGITGEVTVPYKASVASLGLGIGNVWVWDSGFNIGCTWVGYNAALWLNASVSDADTSSVTNEQLLASLLGTDTKEKVSSNVKSLNSVYLLRLQVGYQF
jgi:hypothetical protein